MVRLFGSCGPSSLFNSPTPKGYCYKNVLSTNLFDTFVRYVAAETDDTANSANQAYVGLAQAHWQTNYQGTVQNGVFTPSAPLAITGDTQFTIDGSSALPVLVTSTSANDAAGAETWRQAAGQRAAVPTGWHRDPSPALGPQPILTVGSQVPLGVPSLGGLWISNAHGLFDLPQAPSVWPAGWTGGYGTGAEPWMAQSGWVWEGWL